MREICGECRFHKKGNATYDWVCTNQESKYYALSTDYEDGCECFEQRGVE